MVEAAHFIIRGQYRVIEFNHDDFLIVNNNEGDAISTPASISTSGQGGRKGRYRGGRGCRCADPEPDQKSNEAVKAKLDKELDDYFQNKSD
ncbi:cytochrome P450 [Apiospora arundinis]